MRIRRLIRAAFYLLAAGLAWKLWGTVKDDPILALLYFITGGAIAGLWVVKVILPWMVEAFANSIFMSGGNVPPETGDQSTEDEPKKEASTTPQDESETP
ncbi:MAG: hypothetical protein V4662_05315 [Verrucomicrobiota bacterium]